MSKKISIIFGIIITTILGLWLWTAFIPKNYISIGGSTSVDPVMQRLTNKYAKENKNKSRFIYSSSGSRGGISNMKSGIYDVGFISREIDDSLDVVPADTGASGTIPGFDVNNDQKQNQEVIYNYLLEKRSLGSQFNYLQMGTDAIVLTYYPPEDFAENYSDQFVINPKDLENQQLIFDIYQGRMNWVDLALRISGETETEVRQKLRDPRNRNPIIPYARETGSGTRNSFEGLFDFKALSDKNTPPSKAIEQNSNGIMFTGIQQAVGAFGYLSLNYLRSINRDKHLQAVIISDGSSNFDPLDEANFDDQGQIILENFKDYPLTRPYIGLFKANLAIDKLSNLASFFAWIGEALKTEVETEPRKIYQREGLIPELKFNFELQ